MMDTEIIEALECCKNPIPMCDDCPVGSGGMCFDLLKDYALDLINRQKAENERKDRILESYALQYGTVTDKEVFLKQARAEAIREFAERVERYIDVGHLRPPTEICFSELDVVNIVKRLVKEMTEGQP